MFENDPKAGIPKPLETQDEETSSESGTTESGGRKTRLEPTRYGDWELNGRCIDF